MPPPPVHSPSSRTKNCQPVPHGRLKTPRAQQPPRRLRHRPSQRTGHNHALAHGRAQYFHRHTERAFVNGCSAVRSVSATVSRTHRRAPPTRPLTTLGWNSGNPTAELLVHATRNIECAPSPPQSFRPVPSHFILPSPCPFLSRFFPLAVSRSFSTLVNRSPAPHPSPPESGSRSIPHHLESHAAVIPASPPGSVLSACARVPATHHVSVFFFACCFRAPSYGQR